MTSRRIVSRLTPLLVILVAGLAGWALVKTGPQPQLGSPVPTSPMVMAASVYRGDADVLIRVLGTVRPVQEVKIRSRVTGTVVELHPDLQPGGQVRADEVLLRLDPADYELEVRRMESALARARADLDLEMGQQRVARAELEQLQRTLLGLKPSPNARGAGLALREPHLARVQAALAAAEADVDAARLNLERTVIKAPFNALVTERSVSLGSQAGTSDILAALVNTGEYWIEALVPLDRLEAIRTAPKALPATVLPSSGGSREGLVQRTTGTLGSASRMGQVLVSVADPLGLRAGGRSVAPLMLGDQVRVEINLGRREQVIALPRAMLRGGNTVWVAANGKLDIRTVGILWRDTDVIYVQDGLEDGELVISSDLAAPIQGMSIRLPASLAPVSGSDVAFEAEDGAS